MIWAIENNQSYIIRYCDFHPKDCGHEDECEGRRVLKIPREPLNDIESVDFELGEIIFSPNIKNVVTLIKEKASEEINKAAPLWKQLNELADANSDGSLRQKIDNIRNWSNTIETRLKKTTTKEELFALLEEIKEFNYESL